MNLGSAYDIQVSQFLGVIRCGNSIGTSIFLRARGFLRSWKRRRPLVFSTIVFWSIVCKSLCVRTFSVLARSSFSCSGDTQGLACLNLVQHTSSFILSFVAKRVTRHHRYPVSTYRCVGRLTDDNQWPRIGRLTGDNHLHSPCHLM